MMDNKRMLPTLLEFSPGFRRILVLTVEIWLSPEGNIIRKEVINELSGYAWDLLREEMDEDAKALFDGVETLFTKPEWNEELEQYFFDPLLERVPDFLKPERLKPFLGPASAVYCSGSGKL